MTVVKRYTLQDDDTVLMYNYLERMLFVDFPVNSVLFFAILHRTFLSHEQFAKLYSILVRPFDM